MSLPDLCFYLFAALTLGCGLLVVAKDVSAQGNLAAQRAAPLDRPGEQRVAGENRGRLIERLVHGRPPTPQIVVVHRRQVVVYQRIGVDQFDRAGHTQGGGRAAVHGFASRHDQQWAQPLAAVEYGITHRVAGAGWRRFGLHRRDPAHQGLFHGGELPGAPGVQRKRCVLSQ